MKQYLLRILKEEPYRNILYLVSLILVRAGIQIALYQQGFISVAADEFARGIRAAKWAENPQIDVLTDVQGVWLPFEKYVNGLLLMVWPDVILAPRVTVFIASCLLLVSIYLLTYYLFNNFATAVLSSLFITFQPWYVWLSGTPMLEMYYFACFFAGLLFIIIWLKEFRRRYWFWAGVCFLLASGFHVQSWTLINLVNLLTLPYFYRFIRQREYLNLTKLIVYYALSNGVIISFTLIEFFHTGTVFAFLANHTSYSKWYYNGYDVPIWQKLSYYSKIVVRNSSVIVWLCLFIALIFLGKDKERGWKLFPLLLAVLALLLNSVMNAFSGPPSAAPGRYSLFYVLTLSFYVGYGTYRLFTLPCKQVRQLIRYFPVVIAVFLFSYGLWWGAYRIPDYPQGMPLDAVEVGESLNVMLNDAPGIYMVELRYWEFLAVDLTSRHYDEIIFDREKNLRDRNTPSVFLQESADVCESLSIQDLRYVVLKDESLKLRAHQIDILKMRQDVGAWTIYEVIPESERAFQTCG